MTPAQLDNKNNGLAKKEPVQEVLDWLLEAAQNREASAYGKHDDYSKSQYSKSFGQYSKS